MSKIYTIGHSNITTQAFLELLNKYNIEAIVDIRSVPFSRFTPHFNKNELKKTLKDNEIHYVPMYKELGARREEPEVYDKGQVQFDKVMTLDIYKKGIERVLQGAESYRVAIMCACGKAEKCHRTPMIVQELEKHDIEIIHITTGGSVEFHDDMISRLAGNKKTEEQSDMFNEGNDKTDKIEIYKKLSRQVAYKKPSQSLSN